MKEAIPYDLYYEHSLKLNDAELALQETLLPELPKVIIDSHVHSSSENNFDPEKMSDRVYGHMMSTFPVTDLNHSKKIDEVLMPGIKVRKLRFAHAYSGIDHFGVTKYLLENSPNEDRTAAFGLSDTDEQIEKTIDTLQNEKVSGLKMYYLASKIAKSALYDYFPEKILNVAQEEDKPIILHLPHSLYNSYNEVCEVANKYPDLKIVLAHLGVAHIAKQELPQILDSFAEYENIFADTSQVHDSKLIELALRHLGPEKILYGSDEPLNLLRSIIYENPNLGPRILSDFPYHWVNQNEYDEFIDSIESPFIQSEWQQLIAILDGMKLAGIESDKDMNDVKQKIFYDNSASIFDFDNA